MFFSSSLAHRKYQLAYKNDSEIGSFGSFAIKSELVRAVHQGNLKKKVPLQRRVVKQELTEL